MEAKNTMDNFGISKSTFPSKELEQVGSGPNDSAGGQIVNKAERCPASPLEDVVVGFFIKENTVLSEKLSVTLPC